MEADSGTKFLVHVADIKSESRAPGASTVKNTKHAENTEYNIFPLEMVQNVGIQRCDIYSYYTNALKCSIMVSIVILESCSEI